MRYHTADDVRWCVNRASVTVVARDAARTLEYPQAAIWDLVSRGYATERVIELTSYIIASDKTDAERLVRDALQAWVGDGLIEAG